MDFVWFLLFSTIEAMSLCILMLCLFRFGYSQYITEIIISFILFSLISYAVRIGLGLTDYSPFVTLAFLAFFAFAILRVPFVWSVVMAGTAIVAFVIVQTALMNLMIWIGIITRESVEGYGVGAYVLQAFTAVLLFVISVWMYKKGFGFAFSFNRFRWRGDNILMFGVMFVAFVICIVLFLQKGLFYGVVVETLLFGFLMYLAIRKERMDV